MQVILLDDVRALGRKGVVVDVPEGYARNFLFPQHLAVEASKKALHEKDERDTAQKSRVKKDEKQDRRLAEQIDGLEVVVAAKADKGTLYASVGAKEIAAALKDEGFKVNADYIEVDPIKEIGSSEVTISFPSGFEAMITVVVEGK
ncbi:MAG: 50S ribosomal protein L9 [Candidatus Uhrbacteria bacterium GW2011_GWD2_52_7]|uniref:Large ribosomal subunit protein bL9 n=1 Tax=Candidatus Uhrbacteria bacterium GW2011_GWD2_52_7 TaxID=1618989 RepID=A0A0G1XGL0_9BACT|nr:MAG: 50S ribosomal protein L9 [Candidatus Uhrbacteria bacterium GW2011_GWD2_52_7]